MLLAAGIRGIEDRTLAEAAHFEVRLTGRSRVAA